MIAYLDLLAGLSLAAGMIMVMINALRVGLLPRWMAMLGIFTALLLFFPFGGAQLQIIPAFWMVMMGVLLIGRWPNEPPAWVSGEARPWPTAAERRAKAQGGLTRQAATPARTSRRRRRARRPHRASAGASPARAPTPA